MPSKVAQTIKNRNFKPLPAVTAFTWRGRLTVWCLRALLHLVHLFVGKKWQRPLPLFREDPLHYGLKDLLFFAYKYYFKSPELDDDNGATAAFFEAHQPDFGCPEGFQPLSQVTLTAAGDLMPYEWIQPRYCPHLWDDIGPDFFDSDWAFANLETPIDTSKPAALVPEVMLSDMLFNADEAMFGLFNPTPQYKGFDVLSTANNHSLDMGEAGVAATIAYLKAKNIQHTGTALSSEDRLNCPILEKNGIRTAFIAYTFSMNQFTNPIDKPYLVNHLEVNVPDVDLMPLRKDVLYAKTVLKADFVVLSLHIGNAYQAYPGSHIVTNVTRIFEACGPDVILGGHPHNPQPAARYDFRCPLTQKPKKGFVLFSFADFIAYDIYNWCHLSLYLKLTIQKGITAAGHLDTILTDVRLNPVYVCGHYEGADKRDLRLLDAKKWWEKQEKGETQGLLTAHQERELFHLRQFYERFIEKKRA